MTFGKSQTEKQNEIKFIIADKKKKKKNSKIFDIKGLKQS